MAKQLWLQSAVATAHRGNNDAKLNGTASFWSARLLAEARGAAQTTATVATVAGPTNGLEVTVSAIPLEWLSEPLSADFTISGTITLNLWGNEAANANNVAINAVIQKVDGATGTLTTIATTARTTELGFSSPTAQNFTVTPTSTACKRGDRLRVRVFGDDAGTMGSGGTLTFSFNGATAAANGDSYVQFTENLTFEPAGDPSLSLVQSVTNGSVIFGNNTRFSLSQPFVAQTALFTGAIVNLLKTGTPADNVVVEIQGDSGGNPSGTVVGAVGSVAGTSITSSSVPYSLPGLSITLVPGTTYHLVLRRSGAQDAGNWYESADTNVAQGGWSGSRMFFSGSWSSYSPGPLLCTLVYRGSTYYLTTTAETITPGTASSERKALTTRGSGQSNIITNTATGPTTPILVGGATTIEWFTPPLEAVTLGGKAKFNIRGSESNASANASLKAEIAYTAGDGSSPTVWGLANVEAATTSGSAGELPTTDGAMVAWVAGDDTAITAGQRLRFRIFVDDCGDTALVTGFTATISYNGTSAGAAGDNYVILPVAVTEQVTITSRADRITLISNVAVMTAATR